MLGDTDALDAGRSPEAVIAGTLCLMSCYTQNPAVVYADRVAANLARMASFAQLSPELRTICARLALRWDAIRAEARVREVNGERAGDERALH